MLIQHVDSKGRQYAAGFNVPWGEYWGGFPYWLQWFFYCWTTEGLLIRRFTFRVMGFYLSYAIGFAIDTEGVK